MPIKAYRPSEEVGKPASNMACGAVTRIVRTVPEISAVVGDYVVIGADEIIFTKTGTWTSKDGVAAKRIRVVEVTLEEVH